jgi:hypothetical protein
MPAKNTKELRPASAPAAALAATAGSKKPWRRPQWRARNVRTHC